MSCGVIWGGEIWPPKNLEQPRTTRASQTTGRDPPIQGSAQAKPSRLIHAVYIRHRRSQRVASRRHGTQGQSDSDGRAPQPRQSAHCCRAFQLLALFEACVLSLGHGPVSILQDRVWLEVGRGASRRRLPETNTSRMRSVRNKPTSGATCHLVPCRRPRQVGP